MRKKQAIKNYVDPVSPTFGNEGASALSAGLPPSGLVGEKTEKAIALSLIQAYETVGITKMTLAERHHELLYKNVYRYNPDTKSHERTDEPDTLAVKSALDMAFKVLGEYAPEKMVVGNIDLNQILEKIQNDPSAVARPNTGKN